MNCFLHFRRIVPSSVNEVIRCNKQVLNKYGTLFGKSYSSFQVVGRPQLYSFNNNSLKGSQIMNRISRFNTTLPSYKNHSHASVWIWERGVAGGLIALIPAWWIFGPEKMIESVTLVFTFAHLNWGLEAICVDYLRPSVVGELIPRFIPAIVNIPLLLTFFALVSLTFTGQGVFHVLKQFWSLKTNEEIHNKSKN